MAALTITAANVAYQSGSIYPGQTIGEAATAGMAVYKKSDGKWYKSKCNGTAEEAGATDFGMLLATADAAGARASIAGPGAIVALGTGTAGIVYCPGTTAGTWIPTADLVSTNKVTVGALGIGSNQVQIARVYNAGAVK